MAGRIAFVVTEDWFFASHFLPMAVAARQLGLDVTVITRVRDHRSTIEAAGAQVIALDAERRSLNPLAAGYAAGRAAAILRSLKPDVVHCIALRSILVGGAAAAMAGIDRRVFAVTGLGFAGARGGLLGAAARSALRALVMGPLVTGRTRFLFENEDDPRALGLDPADANRVTLVGGAGIDPERYPVAAWPSTPPLRVAIVSRMLWSKGIDVAVEAARIAVGRGVAVELTLVGAGDRSNPRAISDAQLSAWGGEPAITWAGPTRDVQSVWDRHQVALLPSRGGEGLPRTLLEAASCGRALLTTNVPGCRSFVRDGLDGIVVPSDDPGALADAFGRLAADPLLAARMGASARSRVLHGYTERDVAETVTRLWSSML